MSNTNTMRLEKTTMDYQLVLAEEASEKISILSEFIRSIALRI
jgi:hypothetical protein